jgi:hypothetical protein
MLIMGLRIGEGLDLTRLAACSGLAPSQQAIDRLAHEGLLVERGVRGGQRLVATASGRIVLDRLILHLSESLSPVRPAIPGTAAPPTGEVSAVNCP